MPARVKGTNVNMPNVQGTVRTAKRRRIRLVRLSANRGPNQGAPMAEDINVYPFPFQGLHAPARHGHHPVFGVGIARRLGAWRPAGSGTLGGNRRR